MEPIAAFALLLVRLPRLRRRVVAGGHHRQGVRECRNRVFGANVLQPDVETENFGAFAEKIAIAGQIERRKLQLAAPQPCRDRDVRPDPRRFA